MNDTKMLAEIAPRGQWHLTAEFEGMRYYLWSHPNSCALEDQIKLIKTTPHGADYFVTDRDCCITGDFADYQKALGSASQPLRDAGAASFALSSPTAERPAHNRRMSDKADAAVDIGTLTLFNP